MSETEIKLTCMHCQRPVGRIGGCLARAYTIEMTGQGVGPACRDKGSCRRARHEDGK